MAFANTAQQQPHDIMSFLRSKKGGDSAQQDAMSLFQGLGKKEMELIFEMFPDLAAILKRGMSALSPGGQDAQIAQYRNRALQTAAQSGKQAASLARWAGLGSGTQGAVINDAMMGAQSGVNEYTQFLQSPEYAVQSAQAARGLANPEYFQTGLALKYAKPQSAPKKSFLDTAIGLGGTLLGAGVF